MKREKNKHAFEIKAWADGWEILEYSKPGDFWFKSNTPSFFRYCVFAVNDALVDFRKAEKEGATIQWYCYTEKAWIDAGEMSKFNPREEMGATKLRIKPEYKVGDKVITKGYHDDFDGEVSTVTKIRQND